MADRATRVRALRAGDLEAVVALDREHGGTSRRGFFVKRWRAMGRHPEAFVSLAASDGARLTGFALAHLLDGEFGGVAPVAVLDAIGVAAGMQRRGVGRRLLAALVEQAREHGARELRTRVDWRQRGVLDFFARSGFEMAPRLVLERATVGVAF